MNLDAADSTPPRADASAHIGPHSWMLWGTSMLIAGLGSWLLFDELPGINWTLWVLSAAGVFAFWARAHGKSFGAERAQLLLLACLLAGGSPMTGMPQLQALIALSVGLLAALLVVASQEPLEGRSVPKLAATPLIAGADVIAECWQRTSEAATALHAEGSLAVLRGSLIATPVVLAFFLLLSGADPTLTDWRNAALEALSNLSFVPRSAFFIVLAIVSLGAYGVAARYSPKAGNVSTAVEEPRTSGLADTERLIVLGSVVALFALFLLLQLSHLFGNSGGRAGSGVTFAEAAHRGFIELTVTAALSAVLIIVLDRFAKRGRREHVAKYAALILIAECIPMLLSANSRIGHYEAAYGYTLLRLYVHVYIAVVGVALLLLARQVLRSIDFTRLLRQLAMSAMLAIAVLSFWNRAGWIVERNVERYAALGTLDSDYLVSLAALTPDAVPQLVAALPRLAPFDAVVLRRQLLQQPERDMHVQRWYRWHLRRARADEALQQLSRTAAP